MIASTRGPVKETLEGGDRGSEHAGANVVTARLVFSGEAGVVDAPPRTLSERLIAIGRDPGPSESLDFPDDPRVSRTHATLHLGGPGGPLHVADVGSRNGTFVN